MVEIVRRGEIWVANLNPPRGTEIGKIRPVLIIQENALTSIKESMVIVLPLSTQVYPKFNKWRITINARERLLRDCQVIIDQPRALDKSRIGDGPLTKLTAEELTSVEQSLSAVLGMYLK